MKSFSSLFQSDFVLIGVGVLWERSLLRDNGVSS
jgi:hypothetical protein